MRNLLQDIRYGWRTLSKSPGFSAVVVLTLAVGIGANSTIFSWINATLLNPIPGASNTGNLVAVTRTGSVDVEHFFSYPDYADLRDHSQSFSGIMACDIAYMDITSTGKPERVWGALVSANYFDVLGVELARGRGFNPDEDKTLGGSPVAVISYGLWQSHFAGQESAVGSTIRINQHPYTIVGVAPAAFQGSQTGLRAQLWVPLVMVGQIVRNGDASFHDRAEPWLLPYGRLKPGLTVEQARVETNLQMQQLASLYPESHQGRNDVELAPLWRARFGANYYLHVLLPMLLAIAAAVLLLACNNVANLLLVRSVSRRREIAVRLAMGASRWRLVRQLLVESILLALAGGALAILFTTWSANSFSRFFAPSNLPLYLPVRADSTVLLATLGASLLAALVFGIVPAVRSSNLAPQTVLKEEAGSASSGLRKAWLSSGLVVVQFAGSALLLVCAGLFARSLDKQQRFDIGFNSEHMLLTSYDLFPQGYGPAEGREFHRQLLAKLEKLPGVKSATLANWIPLGYYLRSDTVRPEGYVAQQHESMVLPNAIVGPNYLQSMEIPLVAGRDFTAEDKEGLQRVAIVNEAMAARYWPGQEAMGKRIYVDYLRTSFSVVGIARNTSYKDMSAKNQPFFYLPLYQAYSGDVAIHLRVAGEPMTYAPLVEKTLHELNPNLPVFDVSSLHDRVQTVSTNTRIAGASAGAFGALALVLAAIGIYGVIAYTTRQRTREFGIRMAVGAQTGDIRGLVLGQGLRLTVVGLGVGLAISLVLTRFLKTFLFGITSTDTLTFLSVALLLCLVALAACYIPARRAMNVDPVIALRHE
jgi:predicted permease